MHSGFIKEEDISDSETELDPKNKKPVFRQQKPKTHKQLRKKKKIHNKVVAL